MKKIRMKLLMAYYAPMVLSWLRITLTVVEFIWRPFMLPFCWFQIVPIISYLVDLVCYRILYMDRVPVVLLSLSSVFHFVMVVVFLKRIPVYEFIPFVVMDVAFLVVAGVKATLFPFEVEGEEGDEEIEEDDEFVGSNFGE